jgi:IS6 family transposase
MELHMNPFKGRHFQRDIILWAVRWFCKYGIVTGAAGDAPERGGIRSLHIYRGFSVMRLKWKTAALVLALTLPIFARGTWMKPT